MEIGNSTREMGLITGEDHRPLYNLHHINENDKNMKTSSGRFRTTVETPLPFRRICSRAAGRCSKKYKILRQSSVNEERMKKIFIAMVAFQIAVLTASAIAFATDAPRRPNIVIICTAEVYLMTRAGMATAQRFSSSKRNFGAHPPK
jgi:hypothetical protein